MKKLKEEIKEEYDKNGRTQGTIQHKDLGFDTDPNERTYCSDAT